MRDILLVAATLFGMMLDPIMLVGVIVPGFIVRDWKVMLAIGAGVGLASEILVSALSPGHSMRLVVQRVLAGVILAAVVWGIARAFRSVRSVSSE